MPGSCKYCPLLNLLSGAYGWETHASLRTIRDFSCQIIQVHGSRLSEDMYQDILTNLYVASQTARQETNNVELLQKYTKLSKQIKLISQLD